MKKLQARRVTEKERDIAYIKVWLEDENGIYNPQGTEAKKLHAEVTGNG